MEGFFYIKTWVRIQGLFYISHDDEVIFLKTENTDGMVDITKLVDGVKHACIYIDQFTNTSMEIYKMDITFITLMRTLETTISAICNLLKKVNIYLITQEKMKQLEEVEKLLNLLLQKLQNGIKVKSVLNGIDNTQLSVISEKTIVKNTNAKFVEKYISKTKRGKFCSNNCKSQFRRINKTDLEERECKICFRRYRVNKYSRNITCSTSCGVKHRRQNKSI